MKKGDELAFPSQNQIGYSLTKRELFAAMALQGLLSNAGGPVQRSDDSGWKSLTNCSRSDVIGEAVAFADALIAELSK